MTLATTFRAWRQVAIDPRIEISRLLPSAGVGLLAALTVLNVLLGLLPVAFILATSSLIGHVPSAVAGGLASSAFTALVRAFLVAAACFMSQQVLMPLHMVLGEHMKRRVDGRLRDQAVSLVMESTGIGPMEDREALSALNEATRLLDAGSTTPGMACAGLLALVARYVRLLAFLAVVGTVSSWWAALALGTATMTFRYGQRGGLRKYSLIWRQVAGQSRRAQYLRELALGGGAAKEIRIFGLSEWLSEAYQRSFEAVYAPVAAARRAIYLRPYLFYTAFGFVVAAAVMCVLARNAALGNISLTELAVGIQAAVGALLLGEYYPEADLPTQFGMQAIAALGEFRLRARQCQPAGVRIGLPARASQPEHSVRFEDVSFRYPGVSRPVLSGLNLELAAGKCTAIVGVNGAGKTTLVKLLTRLHDPTAGRVCVDGVDIAAIDPVAWRRQVSVIFQDFIRYELSAADNIALGAVHAPRDPRALERAAEQAGILEAVAHHPLGLQTPLSRSYTGGIELSGGQWQRIAIARSLYALSAGARLLILDEPTSALDVRAEAAFFDRFVELTRGVTSLLISHRFSSVRRADRIVVIDGGCAVEEGSHAELMSGGGRYARLFRLQAQRFAAGTDTELTNLTTAADGESAAGEVQSA